MNRELRPHNLITAEGPDRGKVHETRMLLPARADELNSRMSEHDPTRWRLSGSSTPDRGTQRVNCAERSTEQVDADELQAAPGILDPETQPSPTVSWTSRQRLRSHGDTTIEIHTPNGCVIALIPRPRTRSDQERIANWITATPTLLHACEQTACALSRLTVDDVPLPEQLNAPLQLAATAADLANGIQQ